MLKNVLHGKECFHWEVVTIDVVFLTQCFDVIEINIALMSRKSYSFIFMS